MRIMVVGRSAKDLPKSPADLQQFLGFFAVELQEYSLVFIAQLDLIDFLVLDAEFQFVALRGK